jgi:hypothetical protein
VRKKEHEIKQKSKKKLASDMCNLKLAQSCSKNKQEMIKVALRLKERELNLCFEVVKGK